MPAEMIEALGRDAGTPGVRRAFALKGWHVLAMFVAFFAVVGTVNGVMMTFAIRSMSGLDARNGYDPSQAYNGEIAAARARDALGWRATAQVRLDASVAHVSVSLADGRGAPLPAADITIRLGHPTDRRRDRQTILTSTAPGSFSGDVGDVAAGFWDLAIEARSGPGGPALYVSRQRIRLGG